VGAVFLARGARGGRGARGFAVFVTSPAIFGRAVLRLREAIFG